MTIAKKKGFKTLKKTKPNGKKDIKNNKTTTIKRIFHEFLAVSLANKPLQPCFWKR